MYSTNHLSIPKRSHCESNAAIPWILLRMLIFINVMIHVIFTTRKYALHCFTMRQFMYGLVRIRWAQVRIGYVVALGYKGYESPVDYVDAGAFGFPLSA